MKELNVDSFSWSKTTSLLENNKMIFYKAYAFVFPNKLKKNTKIIIQKNESFKAKIKKNYEQHLGEALFKSANCLYHFSFSARFFGICLCS